MSTIGTIAKLALLAASSLVISSASRADIIGSSDTPVSLSFIGLKSGSVVTFKCDVDSEKSWLGAAVLGAGDVVTTRWGANANGPARWRVELLSGSQTRFTLKALGAPNQFGPRYLSMNSASKPTAPEPFLTARPDDPANVFEFYWLKDTAGNRSLFGLAGRSWRTYHKGAKAWLFCLPSIGDVTGTFYIDKLHNVAWRVYRELEYR